MNSSFRNDNSGNRAGPGISYPCLWEYRVIGTDRERLSAVIITSCAPVEPTITLSNSSSGGKYCSLKATLTVNSEDMRLAILRRIGSSPDVKLVI